MEGCDTTPVEQRTDGVDVRRQQRARRYRTVPPAITPVGPGDIGAGVLGQLRGRGRNCFRRAMESFLGVDGSATYTSFRQTLAGCFHELAVKGDDNRRDVLIPAFCSSDYPEMIAAVGLRPVRYDVEPETLAFEASTVEDGLSENPLAVVSVNVLGYGSPIAELASRCARRDTYLVEALGYALGTTYEGELLGTFGDCAVLNFQQGKPIPVGGGMVVAQNQRLAFDDDGRPAVGANVGAMAGYAALSHPRPYDIYSRLKDRLDGVGNLADRATTHPGAMADGESEPPFETISNFQGTVARRVFDRLGEHRRHRTQTARYYAEELADCPRVGRVTPVRGLSSLQHVRFPLVAETEALRDRIGSALDDVGVQTAKLYDWPVLDPEEFPGAGRLQRTILTLPTHPYVDDRDRQLVVDTVREAVAGLPQQSTGN